MDKVDKQLIMLLKNNGKLSNVELGEQLYISSQAVGKRRKNLETKGIIKSYTIAVASEEKAFVEIYLNDNSFNTFESNLLANFSNIELHKISGAYCYLLIVSGNIEDFDEKLVKILHFIEKYARYRVNKSTRQFVN